MKQVKRFAVPMILLAALIACIVLPVMNTRPAAEAATPLLGAARATAGSGGVTKGLLVKLSAADTIVNATAVTDNVVGVCELTAAAGAMTRYAPIGTQTTVTSGEAISVGDRLTAGTGAKAFVLDAADALSQQVAAVALTAASGADEDVTCIVVAAPVQRRQVVVGSTTSAADSLAIPITDSVVLKTTGADAEALTLADGSPGQVLTIVLATDGGGTGTLTPTTASGFSTIVFADAGDTATLRYIDGSEGWVIMGTAGVAAPPEISQ